MTVVMLQPHQLLVVNDSKLEILLIESKFSVGIQPVDVLWTLVV